MGLLGLGLLGGVKFLKSQRQDCLEWSGCPVVCEWSGFLTGSLH